MRKITTILSLAILGTFFYYNHVQAQLSSELLGKVAPGWELTGTDDATHSSDQLFQQDEVEGVILIFTCNHCPYSKLYEDRIIALDEKYKNEGFPVVAINPNDPEAYPSDDFKSMKKRAKQKGFTFPYLVDETQQVAEAYGATRTPHAYVLMKGEEDFTVEYIGAIDDDARNADSAEELYIETAIQKLKAGERVDPNHTKAIGCSIKWKKS